MDGSRRYHNGDTGVNIPGKSMGDQCLGRLLEHAPNTMVTRLVKDISNGVIGEMNSRLVRWPEPAA